MGVQGLWTLLEPVGKRVNVETLTNKKVAVDASIWIIQFMKAMRDERGEMMRHAHVLGFFRRICKLLFHKIRPVFVFDGATPALKRATTAARRRRREQQGVRLKKTAEKLLVSQLKKHALKRAMDKNAGAAAAAAANQTASAPKTSAENPPEVANSPIDSRAQKGTESAEAKKLRAPKAGFERDVVEVSDDDDDDDDGDFLLPDDLNTVDPAVLSTLPPSIQMEVMDKMREQRTNENRTKFHQASSSAPSNFSTLQLETYLQGCAFRKKMDGIKDRMNAAHSGQGKGKRIVSEKNREYILATTPMDAFQGGRSILLGDDAREGESSHFLKSKEGPVSVEPQEEANEAETKDKEEDRNEAQELDIKVQVRKGECSSEDDDLFGSEDTSQSDVEWEAVNDDAAEWDAKAERGQSAAPLHWRQRAAQRQKFWSRTHGFQMGRKLGDWSEQQEADWSEQQEADNKGIQGPSGRDIEEFELARAIEMSQREANRESPTVIESDDDVELAKAIELSMADATEKGGDKSEDSDSLFEDVEDQQVQEIVESEEERAQEIPTQPQVLSEHQSEAAAIPQPSDGGSKEEKSDLKNGPSETEKGKKVAEKAGLAPQVCTKSKKTVRFASDTSVPVSEGTSRKVLEKQDITSPAKGPSISGASIETETRAPATSAAADIDLTVKEQKSSSTKVSAVIDLEDETLAEQPELTAQDDSSKPVEKSSEVERVPQEVDLTAANDEEVDITSASVAPPSSSEQMPSAPHQPPPQQQQQQQQERMQEELNHLDQDIDQLTEEYRRTIRYSDEPTSEMYAECQELLTLFGIPYIIAPMEAEAQCAYLDKEGLVDGVVTDDSDAFLFGATMVYRNIFESKKYVEEYNSKHVEKDLALGRAALIDLALLLGSDYTEGVHGVGIVNALEILTEFPNLSGFKAWVERFESERTDEDASEFMKKHAKVKKNWLVPNDFPSKNVISAYQKPAVDLSQKEFTWAKPDEPRLLAFCAGKFGWPHDKTKEVLKPVLERYEASQMQLRLESFFAFSEKFAKFRSARIEKAVKKRKRATKEQASA